MSRFAEQIRAFRNQLGLTQRGFAERLSEHLTDRTLQASTVSRWEAGGLPHYEQLEAIYEVAQQEGIDPRVFPIVRVEDVSELKAICRSRGFERAAIFSVTTINEKGALAEVLGLMAGAGVDLQHVQGRVDEGSGRARIDLAFDAEKLKLSELAAAVEETDIVDRVHWERVRMPAHAG